MGSRHLDQEQLATAMNEWMRRYIDDPKAFAAEFESVIAFKGADDAGKVPDYGQNCAAYLLKLHDELTAKAEG